jgi:hypothetical protein
MLSWRCFSKRDILKASQSRSMLVKNLSFSEGLISDPLKTILSEKPRQGVHIKDARDCLLNGKAGDVQTRPTGEKSVRYISDKCNAVVNPDTDFLIQTNRVRQKKVK